MVINLAKKLVLEIFSSVYYDIPSHAQVILFKPQIRAFLTNFLQILAAERGKKARKTMGDVIKFSSSQVLKGLRIKCYCFVLFDSMQIK